MGEEKQTKQLGLQQEKMKAIQDGIEAKRVAEADIAKQLLATKVTKEKIMSSGSAPAPRTKRKVQDDDDGAAKKSPSPSKSKSSARRFRLSPAVFLASSLSL